jgi:DNA-binding transcriptional LysR family regulator
MTNPVGQELPYLNVFFAVCREGGFTAAARRLGCSQPAVSYQVRALERTLRARLIERGGRRVLLTPAGERLRQFCESFFSELAAIRNELSGGRGREPLRLGSASGFGRYVLVPAVRALRDQEKGSGLEIHLRFDSADVVLDRLERGQSEAAFVYTRRISNLLRFRAVYDEELVLIAPPLFASAAQRRKGLAALAEHPFVTYDEGDYVFGRWFDWNFGDQPSSLTSVAHYSELEEVIDSVREGDGLSIVPRDAAAGAYTRGEVELVYAGRALPCINQVYMVVRSGSTVRRELEQLVTLLGCAARDSLGRAADATAH